MDGRPVRRRVRFSKFVQGFSRSNKLCQVKPAARWAWATSVDWCNEHATDGVFKLAEVLAAADATMADGKALVSAGLWHADGHDCLRCPQPGVGRHMVHDFLEIHLSRTEREAISGERRKAGAKGGQVKGGNQGG